MYINKEDIFDDFIFHASIPLIIYMQKSPDQFKYGVF